jgi:hypothetical protein
VQFAIALTIVGTVATVRVYGGSAKSSSAPKEGSPLLAGLIVGIAVIVGWILFARMVEKDVGVVAWGVGGLIGLAVAKSARPPTRATGGLAAVLTVITVLAAKIAVVVFALQPALREQFIQDRDIAARLYVKDMTANHAFSPELQHTLDTRPDLLRDTAVFGAGYELRSQMYEEASARAKTSTIDDRRRLMREYVNQELAEQVGFWVLMLLSFTPLDLLWMGLGIGSAWTLGQGRI